MDSLTQRVGRLKMRYIVLILTATALVTAFFQLAAPGVDSWFDENQRTISVIPKFR